MRSSGSLNSMTFLPIRRHLLLLPLISLCLCSPKPRERSLTLLGINDIYRIEGVAGGKAGGLARVRALRQRLEKNSGPVLVFHAGDALMPAAMSQAFQGGQMIDILNRLDGDGNAFDENMWMTFGNHEFDIKEAEALDARIEESQFVWLSGNIRFAEGPDGTPLIEAPNLQPMALVERSGIALGILSLVIDVKTQSYIRTFDDVTATAERMTAELRNRGAEVVIGLTHLEAVDDVALLEKLGDRGPDLIIGGHDHQHLALPGNGRWVLKADADAKTATVVTLTLGPKGLSVTHRWEPLDEAHVAPDPEVSSAVLDWFRKYDPDGKLTVPVGKTRVRLDAEETTIRRFETALGNWVADQMLDSMADHGAQIAFINSGTLRLNDIIFAGDPITKGHVNELLPYPQDLVVLPITGAMLDEILQHSVSNWNASGHFLQIAGFRFVHDTEAGHAGSIEMPDGDGWRRVAPEERILAVTSTFLAGGGDGYELLADTDPIARNGDLKDLLLRRLAAAGEEGIAPQVEGRIRLKPGN